MASGNNSVGWEKKKKEHKIKVWARRKDNGYKQFPRQAINTDQNRRSPHWEEFDLENPLPLTNIWANEKYNFQVDK
jgi:hypothetical protein